MHLGVVKAQASPLTLLHSERPKLHGVLAFLSAIVLIHLCPSLHLDLFISRSVDGKC